MAVLSEAEVRRIGAKLQHWSEKPINQANTRAFAFCLIGFVLTLTAAQHSPDPIAAIRSIAVMFFVVQGTVHYVAIASLRSFIALGVKEAAAALRTYRNPRRISGFDIAMLWTVVALIAPYFQ
jgi:hypothetical protein